MVFLKEIKEKNKNDFEINMQTTKKYPAYKDFFMTLTFDYCKARSKCSVAQVFLKKKKILK